MKEKFLYLIEALIEVEREPQVLCHYTYLLTLLTRIVPTALRYALLLRSLSRSLYGVGWCAPIGWSEAAPFLLLSSY